jgi:DNA-binding FadR family transcriptional regulator
VPKAGELVAGRLRRQIVAGELREGAALPSETSLMEHFGVSRPTMREAFRMLETEGLITIRRGARGGAQVNVPDVAVSARYAGVMLQYRGASLADVYAARTILESRAAGLLARRGGPAGLTRLERALEESRKAVADPPRFVEADERFHLLVVELGGNETLSLLTGMLYHIIAAANSKVTSRDPVPADGPARALMLRAHRSHERLVGLVRANDAEGAEPFWRRHLEAMAEMLTKDMNVRTVLDLLS